MIRSIYMSGGQLQMHEGLIDLPGEPGILWIDVASSRHYDLVLLRERFGIDPNAVRISLHEDDTYLYMFGELATMEERQPAFSRVTFVVGERLLVTLHDSPAFAPLQRTLEGLSRKNRQPEDACALLLMILSAINNGSSLVVEAIADELEKSTRDISKLFVNEGRDRRELGVGDLAGAMLDLNESEATISRCLESQLGLGRMVRHLRGQMDSVGKHGQQERIEQLLADIVATKDHAAFEHDKVRYLQHSVSSLLNIKQNQIVKVFTVITAAFLPPTLIATFYGMNFAVMPELSWEHGFTVSIVLTFAAALLPLVYIKRKGWLR